MKRNIKLIALDMDGTFLDEEKRISKENEEAVRRAMEKGIQVVISTGRALSALPLNDLNRLGIRYTITANGAAIHKLPEMKCLYSEGMDSDLACEIIEKMRELRVHTSVFIDGKCYAEKGDYDRIEILDLDDVMKNYMRSSRKFVDSLTAFISENTAKVQKFTLQFYPCGDREYWNYDTVYQKFVNDERVCMVTGGYYNLELSKAGVTKGSSLCILADMLGIGMDQTMACGDTENDLDILKTAAVGVAMSNATEDVKEEADFITLSNEESGVAYAIQKLVLE